jgi:hypothetical protein
VVPGPGTVGADPGGLPPYIRGLAGAIFGDYRFGTVFVYYNGAESYYAAKGFRCSLEV